MVDSKNVLLSGGARGIGRCIARHFLSKGHRVFILDIEEEELNYTVTKHLATYNTSDDPRVSSALCDLRDTTAIRAAVKSAASYFGGRIDVVVNNGGIATPQWKDGAAMDDPATLDQFQAYLDVNLRAPFAVAQAAIPFMKVSEGAAGNVDARRDYQQWKDDNNLTEAGPCVVNVSSFRAQMSDPNQEGYASSKAGLLGLTHSMAVSCGRWGIRVNSVSPGRIKATHESKAGDLEGKGLDFSDKDMNDHTTNRAGKGEDIAEAIEYLVRAGFVTGQDIVVDGGAVIQKG